jgi:hypothetical protein
MDLNTFFLEFQDFVAPKLETRAPPNCRIVSLILIDFEMANSNRS